MIYQNEPYLLLTRPPGVSGAKSTSRSPCTVIPTGEGGGSAGRRTLYHANTAAAPSKAPATSEPIAIPIARPGGILLLLTDVVFTEIDCAGGEGETMLLAEEVSDAVWFMAMIVLSVQVLEGPVLTVIVVNDLLVVSVRVELPETLRYVVVAELTIEAVLVNIRLRLTVILSAHDEKGKSGNPVCTALS